MEGDIISDVEGYHAVMWRLFCNVEGYSNAMWRDVINNGLQ